ncbi:MAG: sensor histidine kinase, partial [Nitrosomonas sp.]|nr:sensor histidine kinase [Nitrosomonas sp.]
MFSDLSQSPLSKNLQRLFLLRNIAIAAQCLTFALVYWTIDIVIPWTQMITVVTLLALLNLLTWIRLHRYWPVSHLEFFLQLQMDVLALS